VASGWADTLILPVNVTNQILYLGWVEAGAPQGRIASFSLSAQIHKIITRTAKFFLDNAILQEYFWHMPKTAVENSCPDQLK
jgi:hypothetical protein